MPRSVHEGEPGLVQPVSEKFLEQESKRSSTPFKETLKELLRYGLGTPIHSTVSVNKRKYENGQSQNGHHQEKKT